MGRPPVIFGGWPCVECVGVGEHFRLPLEVDFGIDVGCVDGDMAEPGADGVDINAGAQQVRGCRMPDGVRLIALPSRDGCETAAVRTWLRSIQWMP